MRGMKMPDLEPYDGQHGEKNFYAYIAALRGAYWHSFHRHCTRWLHQMWSDLGRLDAGTEIMQIGSLLKGVGGPAMLPAVR